MHTVQHQSDELLSEWNVLGLFAKYEVLSVTRYNKGTRIIHVLIPKLILN